MKKLGLILFTVFVLSCSTAIAADQFLDSVVEFYQPTGSGTGHNDPSEALGAIDGSYVSVDIPETLTLSFVDNTALDGIGDDLRIREVGNDDSQANVYGSKDGLDWAFLITAQGSGTDGHNYTDIFVDMTGSGLEFINFLKFEGLDNRGTWAGFDLDAVEALNSGPHIVPIPGAIWLLGSGLIGLIGIKRRGWNARNLMES